MLFEFHPFFTLQAVEYHCVSGVEKLAGGRSFISCLRAQCPKGLGCPLSFSRALLSISILYIPTLLYRRGTKKRMEVKRPVRIMPIHRSNDLRNPASDERCVSCLSAEATIHKHHLSEQVVKMESRSRLSEQVFESECKLCNGDRTICGSCYHIVCACRLESAPSS